MPRQCLYRYVCDGCGETQENAAGDRPTPSWSCVYDQDSNTSHYFCSQECKTRGFQPFLEKKIRALTEKLTQDFGL